MLREKRYIRLNLSANDLSLKIELINDVPARIGAPWVHSQLGRIDTAENILANKVTAALNRAALKDMANIWGLCCQMNLPLTDAIIGAQGKAAGIFPVDLSRVLCSVTPTDWRLVHWIDPPPVEKFMAELDELGRSLIFSR